MASARSAISRLSPRQESAALANTTRSAVERAIMQALAYADVFDYPLTSEEVHRYLVAVSATFDDVRTSLLALAGRGFLICREGYHTLPGRESIVETRRRRATVAAQLWPRALYYGQAIAAIPFVRMVTVTGALAADNVDLDADIDYLIVTEPGRLWLCRLMVISVVRLAARRGAVVCPNYFLSERALLLEEQNLFAARELVQMVPIAGFATYRVMRQLNEWTEDYLPNAQGAPRRFDKVVPLQSVKRLVEVTLRTTPGMWLERWEMIRKVRKFSHQYNTHVEANFTVDWCKGHFDGHGQRIMNAYQERLQTLDGLMDNSDQQVSSE
ncbi:MAG: hypothetical protein M3220_11165 [Chloroflexota bacterium]|nr:hypothetical protein [Chloroflexota bacterium]